MHKLLVLSGFRYICCRKLVCSEVYTLATHTPKAVEVGSFVSNKIAGIDARAASIQMVILALGVNEKRVFIEAVFVNGDDLIVGDVFQTVLYQAIVELWGMFIISP